MRLTKKLMVAASIAVLLLAAHAALAAPADEKDKVLRYLIDKYPRLRRSCQFDLCQLHKDDLEMLLTFVGRVTA